MDRYFCPIMIILFGFLVGLILLEPEAPDTFTAPAMCQTR